MFTYFTSKSKRYHTQRFYTFIFFRIGCFGLNYNFKHALIPVQGGRFDFSMEITVFLSPKGRHKNTNMFSFLDRPCVWQVTVMYNINSNIYFQWGVYRLYCLIEFLLIIALFILMEETYHFFSFIYAIYLLFKFFKKRSQ